MGTKIGKGKVGLRALFDIKMDNVSQANAANDIWHREAKSQECLYTNKRKVVYGHSILANVYIQIMFEFIFYSNSNSIVYSPSN